MSADLLIFDHDERGPDEELRLVFEAASQLDDEGRALVTKTRLRNLQADAS